MADFAPPSGPPPPHLPAGWKPVWNAQYSEWFYVNTYTKASQWDKPTEAAHAGAGDAPPSGAPPDYDHGSAIPTGPEKKTLGSNNPYSGESDEAMARRLQAEEEARGGGQHGTRGASDDYYGGQSGQQQQYGGGQGGQQQQYGGGQGQQSGQSYGSSASPQPAADGKKGLFSKLSGRLGGGSSRPPGYPQQQQGYGGYPQQGYGGYPQQQGYGGYPQQQGYGGYPPQQQMMQQQQAPQRHGMGAMGGAALGLGGGLLGGMLIGEAME